jgi:hypothetical protein
MWSLILILPGLIAAYCIFLRPILKALPALKEFYAEADGFWAKVKALSWNSLTIAWSYFMLGSGAVLQWIDPISTALGDPDFRVQVTDALQANPKILSYILMGISAVTIASRLRSLGKAS